MRLPAIGLVLAMLASLLAGCGSNIPPPLPALFRIDEIRYWWEDDGLIVNVTFTNQHPTHTPGNGSLDPKIYILLNQEEILELDGAIGQETRTAYGPNTGNQSISLVFGTEYGRPWQARWHRSTTTGPMLIPPGTTLSVEFALRPDFDYRRQDDGYYTIHVDMTYWYPSTFYQEFQNEENAIYDTGCFNHVVPEFYGVRPGGADCPMWDCKGERTDIGHNLRNIRVHYKPNCTATNANGPDYSGHELE